MDWTSHLSNLRSPDNPKLVIDYHFVRCQKCLSASIWGNARGKHECYKGVRIYPNILFNAPEPSPDMPDEIQIDYNEAAKIHLDSKCGSAALLRLALQKLLKHLGEKGENINADIRRLEQKNILPPEVIDMADTVRLIGNNAVHPGKLSDDDFDDVASSLFDLINYIVKTAITDPKERQRIFSKVSVKPKTP